MKLVKIYKGMENGAESIQANFEKIALAFYPVGAVYQSTVATSPSEIFGGTWQRITGKFLVGVDESDSDFNAGGKTGGTKNLVGHRHAVGNNITTTNATSGTGVVSTNSYTGHPDASYTQLPPYETVFMWKRTA